MFDGFGCWCRPSTSPWHYDFMQNCQQQMFCSETLFSSSLETSWYEHIYSNISRTINSNKTLTPILPSFPFYTSSITRKMKVFIKNIGQEWVNLFRDNVPIYSLHEKWSFSLRISSVNLTKSVVSCELGHIY